MIKEDVNTKEMIRLYLEKHTAHLKKEEELLEKVDKFTAVQISEIFNISRNLASQYLNEWEKEGVLYKIASRPVFFYSRVRPNKENDFNITNEKDESLQNYPEETFKDVIGYDGSLNNVITQCKAAIKYPPNGLPVLLTGSSGAGKSYLANMLYNFAVNENIIEKDKQFVTVNCSEFANNPELLTANLFGYKKGAFTGADSDNMGLIQAADGGVLFLDEVHSLSPSCQEKLFLFMDKGIYHLMGDNKSWKKSSAKLIFATNKKPEEALLKTLLRRIPVTINIPSLEERPVEEKEKLIFSFIKNESEKINIKIKITKSYFTTLMNYKFTANVGELKSAIKRSCANAFLHEEYDEEKALILKILDLPENIVAYSSFFMTFEEEGDNQLIDPSKTRVDMGINKIISVYEEIILQGSLYSQYKINDDEFMYNIKKIIQKYYDYLMFEDNNKNVFSNIYETSLEKIIEHMCRRYKIQFQNNGLIPLIRWLMEGKNYRNHIFLWEENNSESIDNIYKIIKKNYEYECSIADDFAEKCEKNLDITISNMNKIIFLFNVIISNPKINATPMRGVILSHGYSTASSIADAVNELIDDYIFEAIDMPLNVTTGEIGERLQNLLNRRHLSQDIILLVDMGSLEDIYKEIQSSIPNFNIGIINNITTKMALDVGFMIKERKSIENILKTASENNVCRYKIIENRIKEKAILFVSESGIEAAKNMSELFLKSIPKQIDVKIIPYDYLKLIKNGMSDEIFSNNTVMLIAGTMNININEIPYVSVEDIISGNNMSIFYDVLSEVFSKEDMNELQKGMLLNFSLQNVVEYLTILNADKVLKLVNDGLDKLQKKLNIKLKYKSIIGLNVHLSCLVERLIKKIPIDTYFELDEFKKKHRDFIEYSKDSFKEIESHYGVEFPISEIAYIYDYFKRYL